ncbi:phytoene desaturase [Candidatus Woesearchaeota archaeon]|nr:phytoene desaturase [Candidatus Woesearchaeota archaeon]
MKKRKDSAGDKKKIAIVGAGPGGLSCALILANNGFDITVYERADRPGGRNSTLEFKGFRFDTGPTFLMMKHILDQVFEEAGVRDPGLKFTKLSPMYRLVFSDRDMDVYDDHTRMKAELKKAFPGEEKRFDKFIEREGRRFDYMFPCLQKPYSRFMTHFEKEFIRAIPHFALGRSVFDVLGDYFRSDDAKISFTFQTKYLGMAPWDCPGAFAMLAYIEHNFGIYHVEGGLSRISERMAELLKKKGAKIKYETEVKQLIVKARSVNGVVLKDGSEHLYDDVVINADFAHAMTSLFPEKTLKKYTPKRLRKKKYSCSTFMLYLGLDRVYPLQHHTIVFSKDYHSYQEQIFRSGVNEPDISFYVRNSSPLDRTVAPKGRSGLYILVPVENLKITDNWRKKKQMLRSWVIEGLKTRLGLEDIEKHIVAELVITPSDWESDYKVYLGATFNLAHNIGQMLYLRPHNEFEELDNCYLVGGGTHPGSGLPTIYESGRISAGMICRKYGVAYSSQNPHI